MTSKAMSLNVFFTVLLFVTTLCTTAAKAEGGDRSTGSTKLVIPEYKGARVTDLAPDILLVDSNGTQWHLRDHLGQQDVVLILFGSSPIFKDRASTPRSLFESLMKASDQLRAANITVVTVMPSSWKQGAATTNSPAWREQARRLNLFYDQGELGHVFNVDPQSLTLVSIDRAGFLRRYESLLASNTLGENLLRAGAVTPTLEIGKLAPDFSMMDFKGRPFRLADLRGQKNVLLTFFPKCFTGGCTNHLSSLRDQQASFDANQVQVYAVSVDPSEGERGQLAFATKWKLGFPMFPDVGRNLSLLYGAATTPNDLSARMSVLIDKDGIVRWIDKQVNVHSHGEDILLKMKELGMR